VSPFSLALQALGELGQHLVQIADDTEVGVGEDRRVLVLVDRDDHLRVVDADEVLPLWHAVQVETADPDAALPYWAFAWGGGLAMARYLGEHPEAVAGRRVVDIASGSGLCAIAALAAGATEATGIDIDAFYRILLEDHGTIVGPGHWCEQPRSYFRLGYGWPALDELREGLVAIDAALAAAEGPPHPDL